MSVKLPKSMNFKNLLTEIVTGIFLAMLYLALTEADDTNFKNVLMYTSAYVTLFNGAKITTIDPNFVTNAFITKTVFTIVDQRVNKKNKKDTAENKQNDNQQKDSVIALF